MTRPCSSTAASSQLANLTNKDGIRMRPQSHYQSVRGPYKYGNNHFPIQNFYLQEAIKDAEGSYTLKTSAVALKDHQDRYHEKCAMK